MIYEEFALEPIGGWFNFERNDEFATEITLKANDYGWNYMNFTSDNFILEFSKNGGSVNLQYDGDLVIECIVSQTSNPVSEFSEFIATMIETYELQKTALGGKTRHDG